MQNTSWPKTLVIIPAYNEEATIGSVIAEVRREAPFADIAVVNDGSPDGTSAAARKAGANRVLDLPYNMGIGAAMQTGYRYAAENGYEAAVQVDGDGQHPANEIKNLLMPIAEGRADMVVGSRFLGRGDYKPSVVRIIGITFFSTVVSAILGRRTTDTTSGFRAVSRRVIEFFSHTYPDDYPEAEALVLLHKRGFVIMEIPVIMSERKGGVSSITTLHSVYYLVKVFLAILIDLTKKAD